MSNGEYKISVNDMIIKAASATLIKVPKANASWENENTRYFKNTDISVAVAIEGGLITPIVKNVESKGLQEISPDMKILAQKAKESKKNQVKISVKEIQLKPKIDTNDFKIKLQKSRKFLETGDKVKFTMRFRGREAEHPEFGQKVLDNYKEELSDIAELESTSNPDGRSITMVLAPIGGRK